MVTYGLWNDMGPTTWASTMHTVIEYDMAIEDLPDGLPVDKSFTGFKHAGRSDRRKRTAHREKFCVKPGGRADTAAHRSPQTIVMLCETFLMTM